MREEVRPGRREGVGCGGDASGMCTGKDRLKVVGGQGTRGAHLEHDAHLYDLGRVEAERLVERPRGLPSRKAGKRCAARCGPGGREGVGWRRRKRHARGGTETEDWVGTRGAHPEHGVHARDLGRVEAERLVERRRFLPSIKAGMLCGTRCGPGGVKALGGGDASGMCTGMARLKAVGVRARVRSARGT
eukprot:scaffold32656_cov108-Phaeocystis_antarctica.AAC.1